MDARVGTAGAPKRRPGGRLLRRRRILARMREGWAYEEIARAESVTVDRIRKIVAAFLSKRVIDDESDHARVQLARLEAALQAAGEAVAGGDIKAIVPYLRVLDRLDRYRVAAAARREEDGVYRKKLLDKLDQAAAAIDEEKFENSDLYGTGAIPNGGKMCESISDNPNQRLSYVHIATGGFAFDSRSSSRRGQTVRSGDGVALRHSRHGRRSQFVPANA